MFLSKKTFWSFSENVRTKLEEYILSKNNDIDEIYILQIDPVLFYNITIEDNSSQNTANMSILKKASNLSKSMATWAGSGFKKVQQHVYEKRLAICRKCQFWEEKGNMGMGKCLKCGCGKGKHWLPHEQCPIGLWGKEQ